MRMVLQRVLSAEVWVAQTRIAQISHGMLAFVGFARHDTKENMLKGLDKLLHYRMFSNDAGKMSLNLAQVQGELLLVSQFTLLANTQKGLRPDFTPALAPSEAQILYDMLLNAALAKYPHVQSGQFGADMQVHLVNDGPVTFILED